MPAIVLVGAQWGDEGKGKITDLLAAQVDVVARYGGGDNAGHTVVVRGERFALHLIPSGVLHSGTECILGSGMVINPARLVQELDGLTARGVDVSRVRVSSAAHLIMPWHLALDEAQEAARGGAQIGTTRRGIGPAYADKAARTGIRVGDMLDDKHLAATILARAEEKRRVLQAYGLPEPGVDAIILQYQEYAARIRPHITDTVRLVHQRLAEGKAILCEGAQGTLLDLDHGTYPYVTSSSPIAGGALTGLGIGPGHVSRVIGVAKAYSTRVGMGPFPTELTDETGEQLVVIGGEYGTTTGRRRRAGWLDLVALRYAMQVNGITELALTKLDVLGAFPQIKVCVTYRCKGQRLTDFPTDARTLALCEPEYETLPGWQSEISHVRSRQALPPAARAYVAYLEHRLGVPIRIISVGPERDETIMEARP
ncbi:MAG: adenylosuccinate synthase [Anaerolineae bacterium]|nr:adenylosuccinate synthase [Anaerolineae bacterium]